MPSISKDSFEFLKLLAANNNRDWFQANKHLYEAAHANMIDVADALLAELQKTDHIETPSGKRSLMRIYRDVRFSKDKSPYKSHWGGGFRRATRELRGGYYFHIEPGNSFVAGGFWGPNKDDLAHIRAQIAQAPEEFHEVVTAPAFIKAFGGLEGEQLKTAPRDYPKDHPAIDYLRYKQFVVRKPISDKIALSPKYVNEAIGGWLALRPFFDYMSDILTSDLNGVPLWD